MDAFAIVSPLSQPTGTVRSEQRERATALFLKEGATVGSASTVVCDECAEEFTVTFGSGFMGTEVRCVDCGHEAYAAHGGLEFEDVPPLPEHCECGGTFSEDGPFRCPNCRKLFSPSEIEQLESRDELLWD